MLPRFLLTLYLILGPNAPKVHPHHHTLSWGFMLSRFILTIILYPGALCSQGSSSQLYCYLILGLNALKVLTTHHTICLLYTSPSPRDRTRPRMPSSAWKKNKDSRRMNAWLSWRHKVSRIKYDCEEKPWEHKAPGLRLSIVVRRNLESLKPQD